MSAPVKILVNGEWKTASVEPQTTLLELLRETWGLTGAKRGCDEGDCGACTVLLDGQPVNACLILAVRVNGRKVTTIEGLGDEEHPHPLQTAFVQQGALQCGFCGPGMLLSAKALLDVKPFPTEAEIRQALSGNICRCTGYAKIIEAVQSASQALKKN
jgi:aerobic-type carbon monoxide dehydrogenase small subunit (CoxS/CutS family)